MTNQASQDDTLLNNSDAADLLRRIGWHPSDWKQVEVYANMPPARKVTQMLLIRHKHIQSLRKRLRIEHPDLTEVELAHMVLQHLSMLQEDLPSEG